MECGAMPGWVRPVLSSVLTLSSMGGLAGCQSLQATDYGTLTFEKPFVLVTEDGRGTVLMSTPTAQETDKFVQEVLPTNPGRYGYREVYTPEVIQIEPDGDQNTIAFERRAIAYTAPIRNEARTLDVLVLDTPQGRTIVAEPAIGQPLIVNPHQPDRVFFQDPDSFGLLYQLDPGRLTVTPIQADALKALRQEMAALTDRGEGMNPILFWMEDLRFSRGGEQIAFVSNRDRITQNDGMEVWVHDLTTGQDTKVFSREGYTYQVHGWTADGRIVLWQLSLVPGSWEEDILLLDPQTQATESIGRGEPMAISPDGQYLVFQVYSVVPAGVELTGAQPKPPIAYLYEFATGDQQVLFENTDSERLADGLLMDFSADGRQFAAILNQVEGTQASQALWVYDLETQQSDRLPLPHDWQVFIGPNQEQVEWVADHVLVPLEGRGERRSQTLLLPVE